MLPQWGKMATSYMFQTPYIFFVVILALLVFLIFVLPVRSNEAEHIVKFGQ